MKDSKNIVWRWKTSDCLYNFKGTLEIIFTKGQERKIHLFIQEAILNKTGNSNNTGVQARCGHHVSTTSFRLAVVLGKGGHAGGLGLGVWLWWQEQA